LALLNQEIEFWKKEILESLDKDFIKRLGDQREEAGFGEMTSVFSTGMGSILPTTVGTYFISLQYSNSL
jgi:hypothetical protein